MSVGLGEPMGPAGARDLYREAQDRFGPEVRIALPYLIDVESWAKTAEGDQLRTHARQLLQAVLPDYRPRSLQFLPIADLEEQAEIAAAVCELRSSRITQAVVSLFDRGRKTVPEHDDSIPNLWLKTYLDEVGIACYDHLELQDRERFRAYFKRRIVEIRKRAGQLPDGLFLDDMKARAGPARTGRSRPPTARRADTRASKVCHTVRLRFVQRIAFLCG